MPDMQTPDFLELLSSMSPEEIDAMLQPFQQQQGVLDQQMALAQGLRRPSGQQHVSPMGAALGGLSDAVGNVGGAFLQKKGLDEQTALGKRMQADASGRVKTFRDQSRQKALEDFLRRRTEGLGLNQGLVYPDEGGE